MKIAAASRRRLEYWVKERREWSGRVRIVGSPDGSFYFDNQANMLDQFLVNKNMATGDALIKVNPGTAQILEPPAMVDPGLYPKPIPFGGMAIRPIRMASPTTSQSP